MQENERNAEAMVTRRTDQDYRETEQTADTNQKRLTRDDLDYRIQEYERNAEAMATRH